MEGRGREGRGREGGGGEGGEGGGGEGDGDLISLEEGEEGERGYVGKRRPSQTCTEQTTDSQTHTGGPIFILFRYACDDLYRYVYIIIIILQNIIKNLFSPPSPPFLSSLFSLSPSRYKSRRPPNNHV